MKSLHRVALLVVVTGLCVGGADRLIAQTGPFSYFPLTPCRFVDTRDLSLQGGQPLFSFLAKTFTAKGKCGIPSTAKAISVNATIVLPGGAGFLTLYPTGVAKPWISVVDWAATDVALANGALVPLGAAPSDELSAYVEEDGTGTVHLVLDVTGYFQ